MIKYYVSLKPFGDFQTGVRSMSPGLPIERQRTTHEVNGMPSEIIIEGLRTELINNNSTRIPDPQFLATPGNSGTFLNFEVHNL